MYIFINLIIDINATLQTIITANIVLSSIWGLYKSQFNYETEYN